MATKVSYPPVAVRLNLVALAAKHIANRKNLPERAVFNSLAVDPERSVMIELRPERFSYPDHESLGPASYHQLHLSMTSALQDGGIGIVTTDDGNRWYVQSNPGGTE